MNLTEYLQQFGVSRAMDMWIQYSLFIGINLDNLLKIAKNDVKHKWWGGDDDPFQLVCIIESIIITSKITQFTFNYSEHKFVIKNGEVSNAQGEEYNE